MSKKSQTNWLHRYSVLQLVIIGFVAFFVAAFILLKLDQPIHKVFPGYKSGFHEIRYDAPQIVDDVLRYNTLDNSVTKRLTAVSKLHDTAIDAYFDKHFLLQLDPNEFDSIMLDRSLQRLDKRLQFKIYDTMFSSKEITGSLRLRVQPFVTDAAYFAKYPGFGLWVLLIVIQISVAALIISAGSFFLFGSYPLSGSKDETGYNPWMPVIYLIAGVGLMGILYVGFFTGDSNSVLKGDYFFLRLRDVFDVVNPWVYFASAICFAGFISCVYQAFLVNNKFETGALPTDVRKKRYAELANSINQRFNDFFIALGIMLSLAVFASGTLYSSINSLDFIGQVSKALGYSPYSYDSIYLYGLIHSFLLLVLYLPCRFILNKVNQSIAKKLPPDIAVATKPGGLPKLPLKNFSEIVVASSPLLASLLQYAIDLLFNQ